MDHNHNYYRTLIAVADDCPVDHSEVPPQRGEKKSVANIHYDMLADQPFVHTQEDVLFQAWFQRQGLPKQSKQELARLRDEFFATPKPCLRTSPLAKRYGWGFVFDEQGRVALCPMESEEYQRLRAANELKQLRAMKSSR